MPLSLSTNNCSNGNQFWVLGCFRTTCFRTTFSPRFFSAQFFSALGDYPTKFFPHRTFSPHYLFLTRLLPTIYFPSNIYPTNTFPHSPIPHGPAPHIFSAQSYFPHVPISPQITILFFQMIWTLNKGISTKIKDIFIRSCYCYGCYCETQSVLPENFGRQKCLLLS